MRTERPRGGQDVSQGGSTFPRVDKERNLDRLKTMTRSVTLTQKEGHGVLFRSRCRGALTTYRGAEVFRPHLVYSDRLQSRVYRQRLSHATDVYYNLRAWRSGLPDLHIRKCTAPQGNIAVSRLSRGRLFCSSRHMVPGGTIGVMTPAKIRFDGPQCIETRADTECRLVPGNFGGWHPQCFCV